MVLLPWYWAAPPRLPLKRGFGLCSPAFLPPPGNSYWLRRWVSSRGCAPCSRRSESITRVLIVLGVIGFYLYDSAMLLYYNEFVLIEAHGTWTFRYPQGGWQLLGRNPYLPNPLTPYAAIFRVSWSPSSLVEQHQEDHRVQEFTRALNPLRYMALVLLVLLVVELPLLLLTFGANLGVLVLVGIVYLTIMAMLLVVFLNACIAANSRACSALAAELLACAPFAINILRRIELRRSIAGDPIRFASGRLDTESFAKLVGLVCRQLDEALELEDEGNERRGTIIAYRDWITSIAP